MTDGGDRRRVDDDADDGRIGPFSSWRALYTAVLFYSLALILLLYVATRALDFRTP